MAKRNKTSKEEWRRKKKQKLATESVEAKLKAAGGFNWHTFERLEDIPKDLHQQGRKAVSGLSPAALEEFTRRLSDRIAAMQSGEEEPPFRINFAEMANDAKRIVALKPDFRRYKPRKHEKPEDQSVETYLEAMSYTLRVSRQETEPRRRAEGLRVYVAFREARVFHIGHDTYIGVHQEADRYTTEMAGVDYHPYDPKREIPKDENDRYTRMFLREAKYQGWPDKFPFPAIYLGYDVGAMLPQATSWLKAPSAIRDKLVEVRILGHLLTADGSALSWLEGTTWDETGRQVVQWCDEARSPEHGWPRGLDLEPWILPHLVRIINDHRTFVIESELSGAVRRGIKENRKALGLDDCRHMPKPYYSLRLQTHVVRDKVRKQLGRPQKPKSYKTDVRGHERCRIRRGTLPIDPKLADKLQVRGYKLFTTNQLDEETYRRLAERGFAYKKADEWLAVKSTWIDDFMSSTNPKLPYIPAVRKLGNVRIRPRKHTGAWTENPAAQ